jgi:hypothetical protein
LALVALLLSIASELSVDMGPVRFLIGTITGSGPWPGPPPDRRGVMTDDADSE